VVVVVVMAQTELPVQLVMVLQVVHMVVVEAVQEPTLPVILMGVLAAQPQLELYGVQVGHFLQQTQEIYNGTFYSHRRWSAF
jgi:hypothetical protein